MENNEHLKQTEILYGIFKNTLNQPTVYEIEKEPSEEEYYFRIYDHDYHGSSLSYPERYGKPTEDYDVSDYDTFLVELNAPLSLKEEFREEEETYRRKGWNRKLESLLTNLNNYEIKPSIIESVRPLYEEALQISRSLWGEEVYMSTEKTYVLRRYGCFRISFAFKKHNLPKTRANNCMECKYFKMQGVETSHEWVEFFPYCTKVNEFFGKVEEGLHYSSEVITPHAECPLPLK